MKLRELLQQMKSVQEEIGSSEAYICGGTPRDRYLKHLENISDLDITTGDKTAQYLAQEFGSALSKKYNVTRRSHDDGHSSIYIGSFKMDFSSNFNTPNINTILKTVGISNPSELEKEMFSRDFTCNALLLSLDLKNLLDPTRNGFKDIKAKTIMTCLPPKITLTSNKNRVIRAIYLASKLDFDIDPSIVEFVSRNPETVKIAGARGLAEKLNEAFNRDADKASYYLSKMNLWQHIPITEVVRPYYMKMQAGMTTKKAYFQGGGGVNEPTPKEKKYKSDPALLMQPRFEEPLYRNYDLYNVPGKYGPGAGWHDMQKYKSVSEFLEAKRQKLKGKYVADDSWIQDSGKITKENPNHIKTRAELLSKIVKTAEEHEHIKCGNCGTMVRQCRCITNKVKIVPVCDFCKKACDENDGPNFDYGKGLYSNMDKYKSVKDFEEHADKGPGALMADDNAIDFPNDEYVDPGIAAGDPEEGIMSQVNPGGGYLDKYLPKDDFEGKPPTALDFGRDYVGEGTGKPPADLKHIEKLLDKYLSHGLYGLPDGVDLPQEDLGDPTNINPDYGTIGPESLMYGDKWNI